MAEVNQDLVQALEASRVSFAAAGPAFEEDVKAIDAKLAKVKGGGKSSPAAAKKTTARKPRVKK